MPALELDSGEYLFDGRLIIDHLTRQVPVADRLVPEANAARIEVLQPRPWHWAWLSRPTSVASSMPAGFHCQIGGPGAKAQSESDSIQWEAVNLTVYLQPLAQRQEQTMARTSKKKSEPDLIDQLLEK